MARVGGAYVNEPCGKQDSPFLPPRGLATCDVYLDGETIVGVGTFCFD